MRHTKVSKAPAKTGNYIFPACREEVCNEFEFFTSTTHAGAHAGDSFFVRGIPADGEWHYVVVDLSQQGLPTFEADSAGSYTVLHMRFDVFNGTTADTDCRDIKLFSNICCKLCRNAFKNN